MEQYITWYTLQLKAWLMRKNSWFMLIGILLVIVLVSQIHLPSVENIKVGILPADDIYSQKMVNALDSMDSVFEFISFEDQEELINEIVAGNLECGFVLDEEFEKHVQDDDLRDIMTYICTPMTAKGEIVKEAVYAAFLQVYGEEILVDNEKSVFGRENGAITNMLLEEYHMNLENSRLLEMNTEIVEVKNDAGESKDKFPVFPVQGLAGTLFFLMLWLECGRKFEKTGSSVYAALDRQKRTIFEYCGYLAAATVPAVVIVLMIEILGKSRGTIEELLAMVIFVFMSCLWILFVGKSFKSSTSFISWAMTIVLVQVLICPVFVDLGEYFPALVYIRKVFPLNWYLEI